MKIGDHEAGDRVRLADGRIVELAFGMWWAREDWKRVRPSSWAVREIVDDFGGETRGELATLLASEPIAEVVRVREAVGATDPGEDVDPLLARQEGRLL